MVTKDEALKLALEALTYCEALNRDVERQKMQARNTIQEALAQPAPPPECKTEAEQTAYAFGWWKALESVKAGQPAQEPVELRTALAEALTGVYVCSRVWSAWRVGTMTEGDFQLAAECDEVLDALIKAVTVAAVPAAQPAREPVAVYGYCPTCGAKGVSRERSPDGSDICASGHTYKSKEALVMGTAQLAQEPVAYKSNIGHMFGDKR